MSHFRFDFLAPYSPHHVQHITLGAYPSISYPAHYFSYSTQFKHKMPTSQFQTFTHPVLGALTGLTSPSTLHTVHFRSIPFALIPARFRQSTLLNHIPSSHNRDFTKDGTACPSPPQTDQTEASGGPLPGEEAKKFDEELCLNLTISAPRDAFGDVERGLPVMVYVHGGGFTVGTAHVSALHGKSQVLSTEKKILMQS